jgi:hypothetical protein
VGSVRPQLADLKDDENISDDTLSRIGLLTAGRARVRSRLQPHTRAHTHLLTAALSLCDVIMHFSRHHIGAAHRPTPQRGFRSHIGRPLRRVGRWVGRWAGGWGGGRGARLEMRARQACAAWAEKRRFWKGLEKFDAKKHVTGWNNIKPGNPPAPAHQPEHAMPPLLPGLHRCCPRVPVMFRRLTGTRRLRFVRVSLALVRLVGLQRCPKMSGTRWHRTNAECAWVGQWY